MDSFNVIKIMWIFVYVRNIHIQGYVRNLHVHFALIKLNVMLSDMLAVRRIESTADKERCMHLECL